MLLKYLVTPTSLPNMPAPEIVPTAVDRYKKHTHELDGLAAEMYAVARPSHRR